MRNCEGEVSVAGVGWRAVGIKSGTMRDCRNLLNIMSASERVDFLRQLDMAFSLVLKNGHYVGGENKVAKGEELSLAHVADEGKARI